jgi:dolichyl-phosphate-mannose-protein mannosyltransferase
LLLVAVVLVARRPTWQDAVAFGGYGVLFLPWLLVRRSQFLFYLLPAVPFMCLCVVATLRRLPPRWARDTGAAICALAALAALAFFPLWSFTAFPRTWADALRWLPGWHW